MSLGDLVSTMRGSNTAGRGVQGEGRKPLAFNKTFIYNRNARFHGSAGERRRSLLVHY